MSAAMAAHSVAWPAAVEHDERGLHASAKPTRDSSLHRNQLARAPPAAARLAQLGELHRRDAAAVPPAFQLALRRRGR